MNTNREHIHALPPESLFLCCILKVNMRHSSMSLHILRHPFQMNATFCKRQRKGRMWDPGSRAREWRNRGEEGVKYIPAYLKPRQRHEWNVCKWWYDDREISTHGGGTWWSEDFNGPIEEHWSGVSELGTKFVWVWWHPHSSLYEFNLFWFVESRGRTVKAILCLLADLVFPERENFTKAPSVSEEREAWL